MDLTPHISPHLARPAPPITPATQVALTPGAVAAQHSAAVTRTQTVQAPQAAGRAEGTRDTKSGTNTAQANDTTAGAVHAQTGRGYHGRGSLLDVRV